MDFNDDGSINLNRALKTIFDRNLRNSTLMPPDDKITLQIQNTPQGRLLARAITIMDETGTTMGEAMDQVLQVKQQAGSHVYALIDEPGTGSGVGAIEAFVLNAGRYESDVIIVPSEDNLVVAREILADADVNLDELLEGAVYIMRNVSNETLEQYKDV